MDIENCDPKNIFLNMNTGQLECLPGVLIPPAGYSQLAPEVTVKPAVKNFLPYLLAAGLFVVLIKKR